VERNRLKELLNPTDYQELFGLVKEGRVTGRISSLWLDQPTELSLAKPTRESDKEIREAFKTALQQYLKYLSQQVTESHIAELHRKISDLEKRNKELDDKLSKLNELLLPLLEILDEEKRIEEKLEKEMPKLKFKKQDPFDLAKGGWAVPYERAKELLDEE
jgi:vacuolar-type H+-ATPase subunit I/STV1